MEKEERKKEAPGQKGQKKEEPGQNKIPFTIFLFLLIPSIIKDAIELVLGVIPGINLFVWVISLPFVLFIFIITLTSGIRTTWLFIGQLLDLCPFASVLPIATLTVILCYFFEKLPTSAKKIVKKTNKFTPLTPQQTKI